LPTFLADHPDAAQPGAPPAGLRLHGVVTYCNSLLIVYQELMKSGFCLWKPRILAPFLSS
jgi:hypothetical protein